MALRRKRGPCTIRETSPERATGAGEVNSCRRVIVGLVPFAYCCRCAADAAAAPAAAAAAAAATGSCEGIIRGCTRSMS